MESTKTWSVMEFNRNTVIADGFSTREMAVEYAEQGDRYVVLIDDGLRVVWATSCFYWEE